MNVHQLELPSGRKVSFRSATILDTYRIQKAFPDLSNKPEAVDDLTMSEGLRIGIKTICVVSVAPKFWCDLDDESAQVPAKHTLFDLDAADFGAYMEAIGNQQQEDANTAAPLPQTETP